METTCDHLRAHAVEVVSSILEKNAAFSRQGRVCKAFRIDEVVGPVKNKATGTATGSIYNKQLQNESSCGWHTSELLRVRLPPRWRPGNSRLIKPSLPCN